MQSLTHGSDLRLAPTIRPIADDLSASPRNALQAIAKAGFTAVQLDATMPGMRPRELDGSARRDLASTLARTGLTLAGIDFFIPDDHYRDPAHTDRAVASALAACALSAELGRVPVSVNVSIPDTDRSIVDALVAGADGCGVSLAIYDSADSRSLKKFMAGHDASLVGVGIDPAAMLVRRDDPVSAAQTFASCLSAARLSDSKRGQSDGGRTLVGAGDLDLMAYRVSIDLARPFTGPVALDLRSIANPLSAAGAAQAAWDRAAVSL